MVTFLTSGTDAAVNFIDNLESSFKSSFLTIVDGFWVGYVGIFLTPLIIYILWFGIRYTWGDLAGDKFKSETKRIGLFALIALIGVPAIGVVEELGQWGQAEINERVAQVVPNMVRAQQNKIAALESEYGKSISYANLDTWVDDQVDKVTNFMQKRENNIGVISSIAYDNESIRRSESATKTLLNEESKQVSVLITESGAASLDADLATYQNLEQVHREKAVLGRIKEMGKLSPDQYSVDASFSLLDFSILDLFMVIFEWVGILCMVLIRLMRLFLIVLFRLALPLTLAVSLLPGFHDAIKSWWESYKVIALMIIPITLINVATKFAWMITQTSIVDTDTIKIVNALMIFFGGVFYLIAPALTVMWFGGSAQVAQLPSQMLASGWTVAMMSKNAFRYIRKKPGQIYKGGKKIYKSLTPTP